MRRKFPAVNNFNVIIYNINYNMYCYIFYIKFTVQLILIIYIIIRTVSCKRYYLYWYNGTTKIKTYISM